MEGSGHTFFRLPSTFLIWLSIPTLTKIDSEAPTSCPPRSKTYSWDPDALALLFRVLFTARSQSWRRFGSVDMICCGLSSTISWKPTATMCGCRRDGSKFGQSHSERSSLMPVARPLRLKVPAQIWMSLVEEYSEALVYVSAHISALSRTTSYLRLISLVT